MKEGPNIPGALVDLAIIARFSLHNLPRHHCGFAGVVL
jgi:hypothetical protein